MWPVVPVVQSSGRGGLLFASPVRAGSGLGHWDTRRCRLSDVYGLSNPVVGVSSAGFAARRWRQIWSTNPMEPVNKEIKRRTDVVGVFPNPAAHLRLAGAVLVEQHDEWEAGDRRYLSEASMAELKAMDRTPDAPIEEAIVLPELTAA
jgi:hypothetical protein